LQRTNCQLFVQHRHDKLVLVDSQLVRPDFFADEIAVIGWRRNCGVPDMRRFLRSLGAFVSLFNRRLRPCT
jgi:hypothetical protein